MHIRQIRQALNIGGVATEVSAWFDQADKKKAVRGSQIDLIIERADRIIHQVWFIVRLLWMAYLLHRNGSTELP